MINNVTALRIILLSCLTILRPFKVSKKAAYLYWFLKIITSFILSVFHLFFFTFQIKTVEDAAEIGQFCVQLLGLYGNHVDDLDLDLGERTVTYALELCQIHQQWQADAFSIIRSLEKLCLAQPLVSL